MMFWSEPSNPQRAALRGQTSPARIGSRIHRESAEDPGRWRR